MSPELFCADQSDLGTVRLTKRSDCYALGMVIYEVLSGQAPFAPFHPYIVIRKVIGCERPGRPKRGPEAMWFTDGLWSILNQCWATKPQLRPSAVVVLECLEQASRELDVNGWVNGDRHDIASAPPWSTIHYFLAFLCGILCLPQLQSMSREIFRGERDRTDHGETQTTAFTQDHF
jgi:hypothetical protein